MFTYIYRSAGFGLHAAKRDSGAFAWASNGYKEHVKSLDRPLRGDTKHSNTCFQYMFT
jgi:hypothetical protein